MATREDALKEIAAQRASAHQQAERFAEWLDDPDAGVRMAAAAAIRDHWRDRAAADVLFRHLQDPDPAVRTTIIEALIERRDTQATEVLKRVLEEDPDDVARVSAAQGLGELGADVEDVGDVLASTLQNDHAPLVRAYAAEALARLEHPRAVALIEAQLTRERNTRARASMLIALSRLGRVESLRAVLRTLRRTRDWGVRTAILNMLDYLLEDVEDIDDVQMQTYGPVIHAALLDLFQREPSFAEEQRAWWEKFSKQLLEA